jgi:hypothetical protein
MFIKQRAILFAAFVTISFSHVILAGELRLAPTQMALILSDTLHRNVSFNSRLLVKFDLPDSLYGKKAIMGYLEFNVQMPIFNSDTLITLKIAPLTRDWSENNVSWGMPWSNHGGDYSDSLAQYYFLKCGNMINVRIDVSRLLNLCTSRSAPNFGYLIIPEYLNHENYPGLNRLPANLRMNMNLVIKLP